MKESYKTLFLALILIIFGFGLLFSIESIPDGERYEVKCYDKYNNEIVREKCIEYEYRDVQYTLTFMGIIMSSFGILCFIISIVLIISEKFSKQEKQEK